MIRIGLTGFSDHPILQSSATKASAKLLDYSGHFPIVEIDSAFYAIPRKEVVERWVEDTPHTFQFIVKAYQAMTGHQRKEDWTFTSIEEIFRTFEDSISPMQEAGKLFAVLFQFPPWYDCVPKNKAYIKKIRTRLAHLPIAIEFRNQTWFSAKNEQATLAFLQEQSLIHVICDEPQVGAGSVPFVPKATHHKVMFRLHGRNVHGWRNIGNAEHWRKVRFLYNYNEDELQQFINEIRKFEDHHDIAVTFNNNSAHDAAPNAKKLQQLLAIKYEGLAPRQLDFFKGDW